MQLYKNKGGKQLRGYIAIYENGEILKYVDERHRSKICSRNQGKRVKFTKGNRDKQKLEDWIISEGDYRYKVDSFGNTYYFSTYTRAKEYADKYDLDVDKIALGINVITSGGYLVKVDREMDKLDKVEKQIDNKLEEVCEILDQLIELRESMYKELSVQDKKIVKMSHIIEFNQVNNYDENRLYKIMRENFIDRRKVKERIRYLDMILDGKASEICIDRIKEKKEKIDNREYDPWVLEDIFIEGC